MVIFIDHNTKETAAMSNSFNLHTTETGETQFHIWNHFENRFEQYRTNRNGEGLWQLESRPCHGYGPGHENCETDHSQAEWTQIAGTAQFDLNCSRATVYRRLNDLHDDVNGIGFEI